MNTAYRAALAEPGVDWRYLRGLDVTPADVRERFARHSDAELRLESYLAYQHADEFVGHIRDDVAVLRRRRAQGQPTKTLLICRIDAVGAFGARRKFLLDARIADAMLDERAS